MFFTSLRRFIDRVISGGLLGQILLLLSSVVIVFLLFFFIIWWSGVDQMILSSSEEGASDTSLFWNIYYNYVDTGTQAAVNSSGRVWAAIISFFGTVLLSGLLISTFSNIMERRVEACRKGLNYYKMKNHYVIIGADEMLSGLVVQLCKNENSNILIMTSDNAEATYLDLIAKLPDKCLRKRIIVNYGFRDSEKDLQHLSIHEAKEVFVLGDNGEFDNIEYYHDSLNVQCLRLIAGICEKYKRCGLKCHVSFDYNETYSVFQYADISQDIMQYVEFHPFNFYEFWAQKVFVNNNSGLADIDYKPLDYYPIVSVESDKYVHLIVIGMSKMGIAMALQAAHLAHFPNYKKKKTCITFIDREAETEMNKFKQKYEALFDVSASCFIDATKYNTGDDISSLDRDPKSLFKLKDDYTNLVDKNTDDPCFIDIEWRFVQGDDSHPIVRALVERWAEKEDAIMTIAVCLNLTHASISSAMYLPSVVYEKKIPVLVQQRMTTAMVDTLYGKSLTTSERDILRYKNLRPFGMIDDCYDFSINRSLDYAKKINYAYAFYFKHHVLVTQFVDTDVEEEWKKVIKTAKKWSNVYAASSIPTKLRCIGYDTPEQYSMLRSLSEKQVSILSEIEHNRWNVEELLLGYRPVKNEEYEIITQGIAQHSDAKKKEYRNKYVHYDIRPYDKLMPDDSGVKACLYDEVIIRSIPLIINS